MQSTYHRNVEMGYQADDRILFLSPYLGFSELTRTASDGCQRTLGKNAGSCINFVSSTGLVHLS